MKLQLSNHLNLPRNESSPLIRLTSVQCKCKGVMWQKKIQENKKEIQVNGLLSSNVLFLYTYCCFREMKAFPLFCSLL